ncbi:MAG: ISNCY family transposase, partial [Polyangiaceae bacterium]
LVYEDDATSRIMRLHFCDAESTFSYFEATRGYVEQFGKPVAFYSDKASVFPRQRQGTTWRRRRHPVRPGHGRHQRRHHLRQFGSCQRTRRASHLTLQDRLVKELRLRQISSIDASNAFAPEFLAELNARFARAPHNAFNAHRPLLPSENLTEILSWQETRKVSLSLTVNYQRRLYLLVENDQTRAPRGKSITVVESKDGTVQMRDGSISFPFAEFGKDDARI